MAAITKAQLSARLQAIRNQFNDSVGIDIIDARKKIADEEADAINDFVIGRVTNVTITGTSVSGGAVTGAGTGTIQ
jgi:hypothetical protein